MKRLIFLIVCCALFACNDNSNSQTASDNTNGQTDQAVQPETANQNSISNEEAAQNKIDNPDNGRSLLEQPDEYDKKAMEQMERTKQSLTQETYNTTSVYRYIITEPNLSMFAKFVKKSDWTKYLHHNQISVLAPRDKWFKSNPDMTSLLDAGNEEALNEFVERHIIPEYISYKSIKELSLLTNKSGTNLKVAVDGDVTIDGVRVLSDFGSAGNGFVMTIVAELPKPE